MRLLLLLLTLSLFYGCGSRLALPVPDSFDPSQLNAIFDRNDALPVASVASIAGVSPEKLKQFREIIGKDNTSNAVLYSWPNGEKRIITTQDQKQLTTEAFSSLGIAFFRKTGKAAFQMQFESADALQQQIDQLTKDKDTDPDLAIAEAKYLAGQAQIRQFNKMEKVGELSYWETPVQALHVYVSGYAFTITTNLPTETSSRNKAVQLAGLIFESFQKSKK
ncbi:hypothetical protein [Pseudoflavitalea rhizosphaerae]|uniref:hypothetical protein n=1 Tax=Pseudoflavitalea rhizosphaerae TaxID=1884793 RepID=UPI000F8F7310|nr:hypothetical protein [Pseudoflavitalea rhizosphaerae]